MCRDGHLNTKEGMEILLPLKPIFLGCYKLKRRGTHGAYQITSFMLPCILVTFWLLWYYKYHKWGNLEKGIYLDLWFQREKSLSWWGIMAAGRHGSKAGSWDFKFSDKHETERTKSKVKQIYPPSPSWHTSSSKAILLKPPQTMSPIRDQVFKYMQLWGTLLI